MKLRFNGILEKQTSGGGCNCKKSVTGYTFIRSKLFILPSNTEVMFYEGQIKEVSDRDGEFLLGYRTADVNGVHEAFTKVED